MGISKNDILRMNPIEYMEMLEMQNKDERAKYGI